MIVTYDEHGGFYDHVQPPRAPQGGARTPDDIEPGQCADLSNVPASQQPGGGAQCSTNLASAVDTSVNNAIALCPALASDPTGPFPKHCATFDQLGFRVPFIAVSPFAKPHYVSHTVGDHTSLLALIEKRFMSQNPGDRRRQEEGPSPHPARRARRHAGGPVRLRPLALAGHPGRAGGGPGRRLHAASRGGRAADAAVTGRLARVAAGGFRRVNLRAADRRCR